MSIYNNEMRGFYWSYFLHKNFDRIYWLSNLSPNSKDWVNSCYWSEYNEGGRGISLQAYIDKLIQIKIRGNK